MNLLITGAWKDANNKVAYIETMGHVVYFMQYENGELPCNAEWIEGIICNGLFLYYPLSTFPNLRFIQLISAGYDRVDMSEVIDREIKICNAKNVYSIPMAEYAVWGVLELYKHARSFYQKQKAHIWEKDRGLTELYGKSVAIIGCGDVGRECAKRFNAFGCSVIEVHRDLFGLDEALNADIVVVSIALTKKTRRLIKPTQMKSGSILVNISRGEIVDSDSLLEATQLLGVVLDVFDEEPLVYDSTLWDRENCIITPHNSFIGEGNQERLWNVIKDNLEKEL